MAIDPNEINSIEDSMVHDIDEEPHPEGWGIYVTLRFLSKVILAVYGLMLLGMLSLHIILRYTAISLIPTVMRPESTLIVLPIALVAAYLYLTSVPEPEISKKRTPLGKCVTFIIVFLGMQAASILTWIGLAKAFSLR